MLVQNTNHHHKIHDTDFLAFTYPPAKTKLVQAPRALVTGNKKPVVSTDAALPLKKRKLNDNFGSKPGENIQKEFDNLQNELKKRFEIAYSNLQPKGLRSIQKNRTEDEDLVNAINGDLWELKEGRYQGSQADKVALFNRLSFEASLEIKYNVNLTHNGTEWSESDLVALDIQLGSIPSKFASGDPNLREIRMQKMAPGVGGMNYGRGLITLPTGGVSYSMIHEIGHDFDDENPKWNEFKALSGWKDVTSQFTEISGDYDKGGAYIPAEGTAKLKKDTKLYQDGTPIDIDGDGKSDGTLQLQHGRAMVYNSSANFFRDYARVDPYEDFAVTFDAFFKKPWDLKASCPDKFQFMLDFTGVDPTKAKFRSAVKI